MRNFTNPQFVDSTVPVPSLVYVVSRFLRTSTHSFLCKLLITSLQLYPFFFPSSKTGGHKDHNIDIRFISQSFLSFFPHLSVLLYFLTI